MDTDEHGSTENWSTEADEENEVALFPSLPSVKPPDLFPVCSSVGKDLWAKLTDVKVPQFRLCDARSVKTAIESAAPEYLKLNAQPVKFENRRLAREWKTVSAMIHIYCRGKHSSSGALCTECQQLSDYASLRLDRCRFGAEKPTCAKCPVHCYQKSRREQIKAVMIYSGPRMLLSHPILSLFHWLDSYRKAPALTA